MTTDKNKQIKKSIQAAKLAFYFLQEQGYPSLARLIEQPIVIALDNQGNDSEEGGTISCLTTVVFTTLKSIQIKEDHELIDIELTIEPSSLLLSTANKEINACFDQVFISISATRDWNEQQQSWVLEASEEENPSIIFAKVQPEKDDEWWEVPILGVNDLSDLNDFNTFRW